MKNDEIEPEDVKEHYDKIKPVLKEFAVVDGYEKLASKGPASGWYSYPEGYDGSIRRPRFLNNDYDELARVTSIPNNGELPKSLYCTLNAVDIDFKDQYKVEREEGQDWGEIENPLPDYKDIDAFNLFADVDLDSDKKPERDKERIQEIVEKSIKFISDRFERVTSPAAVFCLDSGGGFYPLIHHRVLTPICNDFNGEDKGKVIQEIMNRFNEFLEDVEKDLHNQVMGASQLIDVDTLNNKNRLFKAPGSIHRSLNVSVKPVDLEEPDYTPWTLPIDENQVKELKTWVQDYKDREITEEPLNNLIKQLFDEYDGDWKERLNAWIKEEKEREKKRREKRRKAIKSQGDFEYEELEDVKGQKITNKFKDLEDSIDLIDMRDMVREHKTGERGDGTIDFNPPWRKSESGTGAFASEDAFTDRDGMKTGGPVDYVALDEGIIMDPGDDLTGKDWFKAVNILRNRGYDIPIYVPDADEDDYDKMPRYALQKASKILGIADKSDFIHVERKIWDKDKEEKVKKEFWWLPSSKYNETIRELENRGFNVNRDKKYFTTPLEPGKTGKFKPKLLADDIKAEFQAITTLTDYEKGFEAVYVYENGIYKPGGKPKIKELARKKLGADAKNHWVKETYKQIKQEDHTPITEFNQSNTEIVVDNGILNLETGELRDFDPELKATRKIPVEYDPDADCPEIKKFIEDVIDTEDKKSTLQEFIGHCIAPDYPLQKALLCIGSTDNGKTVFLDLVARFLGDQNVSSESLHDLCIRRFSTYNLYGKLANIDPDLSKRELNDTGKFKALTGGDRVNAEKKRKQPFSFKNEATLLFACNDIPKTKDKSDAFYNRWIPMKFPYTFKTDPDEDNKYQKQKIRKKKLMDKLTSSKEFSGLLNWAMTGLQRIKDRDRFTLNPSVEEVQRIYETGSNDIYQFFDEVLITKERAKALLNKGIDIEKETGLDIIEEKDGEKQITNREEKWDETRDRVWKVYNQWVKETKGSGELDTNKAQFVKDLNRVPEMEKIARRVGPKKQSGKNKGERKQLKMWKRARVKEKWIKEHLDEDNQIPRSIPKYNGDESSDLDIEQLNMLPKPKKALKEVLEDYDKGEEFKKEEIINKLKGKGVERDKAEKTLEEHAKENLNRVKHGIYKME